MRGGVEIWGLNLFFLAAQFSELGHMLKRLHISNFALINEMDVTFPGHLTVITGETGAGKSIFLEALGLALGKRAEQAALQNKTRKCIVEAEFDVGKLDLQSFFSEQDIEPEASIILRREISPEGKSRSFLNDSVVSLSALKILAEKIIDIHSQHQTLLLNQENFQLELVDAFAGTLDVLRDYKQVFSNLQKARKALSTLSSQEAEARKQLDYFQFLFKEFETAALKKGDLQRLEEERAELENAETIRSLLLQAAQGLQGGDHNLLQQLARIKGSLTDVSKYSEHYKEFATRLTGAYIELKELAAELEDKGNQVHSDAERITLVNGRLDLINHLLRKHNVKSEEELLCLQVEVEEKLLGFSSIEKEIEKSKKQVLQLQNTCQDKAQALSKKRKGVLSAIESEVQGLLKSLSMQNASFKIELQSNSELGAAGLDQVRFLFSANKGSALSDLSKVASGGELSRLMLSLKAIMASRKQLPTIIFDEIDTGVSGDVADKIGNILLKMGETMQVVTITHLPQMASKGGHHLFVYKKEDDDQTVSHIRQLSKEERVTEIAKMLSTGKPTESALKNAKELLRL